MRAYLPFALGDAWECLESGCHNWKEVVTITDIEWVKGAFLIAQLVKNLPAMQETRVRFLDQEHLLEKEMATHSSILAGKSHGQRSLAGHSPWGRKSQT